MDARNGIHLMLRVVDPRRIDSGWKKHCLKNSQAVWNLC